MFLRTRSCVLVLGTLGLPDNFEGSGGAVFTSIQSYVTIHCHRHADGNNAARSNDKTYCYPLN